MMFTLNMTECMNRDLQELVSAKEKWEDGGAEHMTLISHLPHQSYRNQPDHASPVNMYWGRDRYWSVFYEKLFRVLVKLNFSYRINIISGNKLVFDVTPEALETELKETVAGEKKPLHLFLEHYENEYDDPFDEDEIKSKILAIFSVGIFDEGVFHDDVYYYSNDDELNNLTDMLVASEGLFSLPCY